MRERQYGKRGRKKSERKETMFPHSLGQSVLWSTKSREKAVGRLMPFRRFSVVRFSFFPFSSPVRLSLAVSSSVSFSDEVVRGCRKRRSSQRRRVILEDVVKHMQCNRSKRERDPSKTSGWLKCRGASYIYMHASPTRTGKQKMADDG